MKRKPKQSEIAAIEVLLKRIKLARGKGNLQEAAELYNQLGNQHRLLGNFEDAIEAHQEEVNISKRFNRKDKMGLGIAYRNLGEVLMEMKNESKAVTYVLKYLHIAKEEDNLVEQQRAYITLGRTYLSMAERDEEVEVNEENVENQMSRTSAMEKGYQCFKQAYFILNENELKEQIKDEKELMLMKCSNCQNIGLALEQQGKLTEASAWLTKAIDIAIKYQFHDNLAPCYTVMCGISLKVKKWKDALNAAKNATKTAKILGNRALETESQLLEAKALFMYDEVDTGKKILKKLRKKIWNRPELHSYFEELDLLLTASVRISRTQDELFVTDDSAADKNMKLHETLGDNYITLMNYETAIRHYKKACEFAEILGIGGKQLSKLFFSIAETYRDLENYASAYKYYLKEMQIHVGNPVEEFKTQTNITVVLEKLKKPVEELIDAHELAVALAKLSKSPVKEVTALNNYSLYLQSVDRKVEAKKLKGKADEIQAKNNISDLDEPEPDSQDLLQEDDNIDLDDLSEEEDSDDEEDDDRKVVKKRVTVRINESGESQLHLAAKKGDLKATRRLIRQGHKVNIRDNAGWTPLHEACNFGHAAVVEELLKNGADVNDNGGALAEKITPLHDAAGNGHCDVMKVLIKYGAKVLARDAEGKYPVDLLLVWRESDGGKDCSEVELESYREVKELLKEGMAQAGKAYSVEDEKRTRKKARVRKSGSPTRPMQSVLLVTKPYEQDCPILATTVVDDFDPDKEGSGANFYKNAMKQVGRKSLEDRRKKNDRPISPGPRGALIPSEKDFHQKHDDWLLPDDEIIPTTSTKPQNSSKSKRKRDPMDDVAFGRSTKRKTGGKSRSIDPLDLESDSDEEIQGVFDNPPESNTPEEVAELPGSSVPTTSRFVNPVEADTGLLNHDFNDEDFSAMLNDEWMDDNISLGHDDFLPSQRPAASRVEFGRTRDVPEVQDSDSDDDDDKRIDTSRVRSKQPSPTKRYRTLTISSDEEEASTSRTKNKQSFSNISNVLKNAVTGGPNERNNRKEKPKVLVQTRLPVRIVPRSTRHSDTDDTGSSGGSSPVLDTSKTRRQDRRISGGTDDVRRRNEVLRLKISILDKVLLVPVDDNHKDKSIDWLAQECSTRYLKAYGVKPTLHLQTKDGASLTGTDPISLVLEATERELNGIVSHFDLPPLVERYSTACVDNSTEVNSVVKEGLNNCQSSNVLHLSYANLRGVRGTVLMTALRMQTSLKILVLSNCALFDTGLSELCKALPTLPTLTELDLTGNGITKSGFINFVEIFRQENHSRETALPHSGVPLGLNSLVLSHNPLGNLIGTAMATLLDKLPALRRLEIADCNLSDRLFIGSGNGNELHKALNSSRLEDVNISYNCFKDIGIERLLQSLPARRIRNLNCSACVKNIDSSTNDAVAKAVGSFLSGNEDCCNLRTLQLNDCGLTDKSMEQILDNFDRLVRLENLELSSNSSLTALSLVNILERSVEREVPLETLDMGSIPSLWNTTQFTEEQVLLAVTKKMESQKKLSVLKVPITQTEPENTAEDGSQVSLSKLEGKMVEIMSDYAGNTNFQYEKRGGCIVYRFED